MSRLLDKVAERRRDPMLKKAFIQKALEGVSDFEKYIYTTMAPIDDEYTQQVRAQGREVIEAIKKLLSRYGMTAEYEYQGSVTNNTHVKAHSDLDILTIHSDFYAIPTNLPVPNPFENLPPYDKDPVEALLHLRTTCEKLFEHLTPDVSVDITGSKSIALSGDSLFCKVDIVPGHWLFSSDYVETGDPAYKGVFVLNKEKKVRIKNTPFLHNKKIDDLDTRLDGKPRQLMRLMKSIKYDSDQNLRISSYDLVSLVYRMPEKTFFGDRTRLVEAGWKYLCWLDQNIDYAETLLVPDESRKIFAPGATTRARFRNFVSEYKHLLSSLNRQLLLTA